MLICYTLALMLSAAPQLTLIKHACSACNLSLHPAVRARLQTPAAERGGKDPLGLLLARNYPSSFDTPFWVFPFPETLIQIKIISEACLTPAGTT